MRLTALALLLALPALRADEGMWTFDNIPVQKIKAKYGVELDGAWLKKLQLATVRFPGGTGAFVSGDGLVVTTMWAGAASPRSPAPRRTWCEMASLRPAVLRRSQCRAWSS